jgi:hypothetical protein
MENIFQSSNYAKREYGKVGSIVGLVLSDD